jgi:hypothetical protein
MKMKTSCITKRVVLGILIGLVFLGAYSAPAPGHFAITYYDNYNYETGEWDAWQDDNVTPLDAWDDKYLADDSSGKTVFTDHAFTSIATFDLRGGLWSKDGHDTNGEDWNPLQSIGDDVSGQSAHHVFAALFKGMIYLEEGDVLWVASDDDVYIFLDDNTAWGQEVLSVPYVSWFDTNSMVVTAEQAGYHVMTVKYIERRDDHSGIEITLNGEHLQNAELPIDIKPGSCPNPLNVKDKGVLPVAILGTEDFDVFTFDPASARLEGVAPIRSSYEDVSTPVTDTEDECACTTAGSDGYIDLTLKFNAQEVVDALGHVYDGDLLSLTLTVKDNDGVLWGGTDCVIIIAEKAGNPKKALVGHWKLDETNGSTAYDSSDNGNNGSVYGDLLWQPNDGQIDGALLLDGVDDYVDLPVGSLVSELTNCTIATWVNWTEQGSGWQRIFDFGSDENVNMFLTPSSGDMGPMRFAITVGGSGNEEQVTAPEILPLGWHHVCVTIDADDGVITLYLDGLKVAENPSTTLTPSALGSTSQNWLGRSQYEWDAYYNGMLDDFRIYNEALSPGSL